MDFSDSDSSSSFIGDGDAATSATSASAQLWIRDQFALRVWQPGMVGLVMSTREVIDCFGIAAVTKALQNGMIHLQYPGEPGASIRRCRENRGWTQQQLAEKALVAIRDVSYAEANTPDQAFHTITLIARALGIDPRRLCVQPFGQ